MESLNNSLVSLGFTQKEATVLMALYELGRTTVSNLAKKVGEPRTTVTFVLERLKEKGVATRVRVGAHSEWQAAHPNQLYELKNTELKNFKTKINKLRSLLPEVILKKEPSIEIYRGLTGLRCAYDLMLKLRRGDRILAFEGEGSTRIKQKIFSDNYTTAWQSTIKNRGIILDVVTSDTILDTIKRAPTQILRTARGRATIAQTLPTNLIDSETDIFVFNRTVLIITPVEKIAVVINEGKTARAFKQLLRLVISTGNKIDLNNHISSELARRGIKNNFSQIKT